MEDRRVINDSYFCARVRTEGPIAVLTTTQYVVGEYYENTGDMRWQRVVNATQKDGIHNWLREHFPPRNLEQAPEKPVVKLIKAVKPARASKPAKPAKPAPKSAAKTHSRVKPKSAAPAGRVKATVHKTKSVKVKAKTRAAAA